MVLSGICTCQPRLQTSHRPDGIFTCFALMLAGRRCLHQRRHGELLIVHHHWQLGLPSACSRSKVPIAPMGISHVSRLCLQGGGVYIYSATVSFSSCTITGNTAQYVRAHAQKFPSPRWETADALASSLTCTTVADASMNYSEYVPQRPRKFPWP